MPTAKFLGQKVYKKNSTKSSFGVKAERPKQMIDGSRIAYNLFVQALSTLLSRCSGLIRDVVTAHFLGANNVSDAFFASFRIPNSIRKLIGEGPLAIAFVPIFIECYLKDKKFARRFAGAVFLCIFCITIFLSFLLVIFMPQFLAIIVPGLKKTPSTFEMAIVMSRISTPFMVFTCLVAVLGGITNGIKMFFPFGITPFILNFCMTCCLIFLRNFFGTGGIALSFGVVVGGVVQIIFMCYVCKLHNVLPIIKLSELKLIAKPLKMFFANLTPVLFGQGVFQVNMFVDGIFASYSVKTQSYMYYSDRLSQFAITIIGHTLGVVALPTIASYIAEGYKDKARIVQSNCINWAIIWSIPASVCLFILAHPIIQAIYMRGQFGNTDVYYVGNMLKVTCIVIPIMSLNRVLYSSIYAMKKVTSPVVVGFVAVVVNILVNILLMSRIKHYYICISGACSVLVEFVLIALLLQLKYDFLNVNKQTVINLLKVLLVVPFIGLACFKIYSVFGSSGAAIALIVTIPSCIVLYILGLLVIGVFKKTDLIGIIDAFSSRFLFVKKIFIK